MDSEFSCRGIETDGRDNFNFPKRELLFRPISSFGGDTMLPLHPQKAHFLIALNKDLSLPLRGGGAGGA